MFRSAYRKDLVSEHLLLILAKGLLIELVIVGEDKMGIVYVVRRRVYRVRLTVYNLWCDLGHDEYSITTALFHRPTVSTWRCSR